MVISCLSGVRDTLDTYRMQHDKFDFESELGWEGSNDQFLNVIKALQWFVPPTQCNAEGKPQGGYFNLDKYIKDCHLPQGKKVFLHLMSLVSLTVSTGVST